jgi:predicted ATPase/DNA-binding SARP family transcriptional activator/class 3 adenylate cyclase
VEYRVLGPIEVVLDEQPLVIGGFRQRLVLALLVSRPGKPASTDWLVNAAWGGSPPRTARRTLQAYITRLRRVLGSDSITTLPSGYTLVADPDEIDWMRFEVLAGRGDRLVASDPSAASATLRQALGLWRGDPYGDLGEVAALAPEIGRLQELRLATTERRIDADLAVGHAVGLVAELEDLVAGHPLREGLRRQLMLALYRSDRQADALAQYAEARRVLDEELGIMPSTDLRTLHEMILRQDTDLDLQPLTDSRASLPGAGAITTPEGGRGSDLPSGLVTFVMTDIEGSTRLLRQLPDEYAGLLARHREILADASDRYSGAVVSTDGDGTFLVFAHAADALRACADAQVALTAEPWPHDVALRVRMGVHSGLAVPKDGDYVALAAHQVARVSDAANGGQVLSSAVSANAVHGHPDLPLIPLGRYRLRDFDQPEPLYQLDVGGRSAEFPPVRALPAERHNLSLPRNRFVDRVDERAFLVDNLAAGALVTVAGPGGVGKTRLTAEVGVDVADGWPDGVWRVPIDTLGQEGRLVASVAESVGVRLTQDDATGELLARLSESQALLVLDGCERHLTAVATLVDRLLSLRCRCAVLATSREPLHLPSEIVLRLRPLSADIRSTDGGGGVSSSPAVDLFVDRARAANAAFELTSANQSDVLEVVRRLDGLPLAEEIAAAKTVAFSPAELLESLDQGTRILQSPNPALPERHRTIQNLLRWSEDLLSEAERATFRRLAVFAGPFTLAHARVAAAGPGVDEDDLPDHVWALVDQSLVLADPSAGGTRYRMLDLVRRFAENRLADNTETESTALRVGRMYLADVGPSHASTRQWMTAVGADLDSIRGVVSVLARSTVPDATELAGQLAVAVVRYLEGTQSYRSGIDEAEGWLRTLPAAPATVPLLAALAMLHLRLNEIEQAERLARRAEQVRDDLGAPAWAKFSVERALGEVANRSGRPEQAAAIAEEALARAPDARSRARLFNQLGNALVQLGDIEGAAQAFDGDWRPALSWATTS